VPGRSRVTDKARYWMLTIPHHQFTPYLPASVAYIKGQLEQGTETPMGIDGLGLSQVGYLHWQLFVYFKTQQRLSHVRKVFGPYHAEPTKSDKAEEYVWKEETRIEGTQFELGERSFKRNDSKDWAVILASAKRGDFETIPADVYIRCYGNLKRIAVEHAQPTAIVRTCRVYWGPTGTGKSRRAWDEASLDAYPKDPMSKFWDGYRGQENVVIDEFRGSISISHLLRWLDRYPVLVEVKGSSVVFKATTIWITSNLHPREWYKDLDAVTYDALERRLDILEIN